MRPDRSVLAKLRITPCGLYEPGLHILSLVKTGDAYRVEVYERQGLVKTQRRWRVDIPVPEVDEQLARLKQATLPAFPISPLVCDGEHVELTVEGAQATLTLGWWTIAPEGADALADFSDWMRLKAFGEEIEPEDDEGEASTTSGATTDDLTAAFEPDGVSPPGASMLDIAEERGWIQAELAQRLGYSEEHISLLIDGKVPLSVEAAEQLERVLGSTADFWLAREANYQRHLDRLESTERRPSHSDHPREPQADLKQNFNFKEAPGGGSE